MTKTRIELRTRAGRQEGEDWVKDRLIQMPLSSVGDLTGFGVYDPKQCLTLLSGMKSRGQVFEIALGATEPKVRRWALTRNEILKRYREQNKVHWAITANGLKWLN